MEVSKSAFEYLILSLIHDTQDRLAGKQEKDDVQEMAFYRLEQYGYTMGYRLASQYAHLPC